VSKTKGLKKIPKFDVLLPVYIGDTIEKFSGAIESIKENSVYPENLIITIDGAIKNDIAGFLEKLDLKNIKVIKHKIDNNTGLANALNQGLLLCQNEIVFRCDADDFNLSKRFEIQMRSLLDQKLDILGSYILEVDPIDGSENLKKVPIKEEKIRRYSLYRNPLNHMSVVFKKTPIIELGGYPTIKFKEDYGLWIKCIHKGLKIGNVDKVLVKASAGLSMVKRRKGFESMVSEYLLLKLRISLGQKVTPLIAYAFLVRLFILFLPIGLLKKVYKFLRR